MLFLVVIIMMVNLLPSHSTFSIPLKVYEKPHYCMYEQMNRVSMWKDIAKGIQFLIVIDFLQGCIPNLRSSLSVCALSLTPVSLSLFPIISPNSRCNGCDSYMSSRPDFGWARAHAFIHL